jgi:hypothetical protein
LKLKFGRGARRLFDVNIATDYFLDNGACIQLVTNDHSKTKLVNWASINYFIFPKARFNKLLKNGYIHKIKEVDGWLIYYNFTKKIYEYSGEFI